MEANNYFLRLFLLPICILTVYLLIIPLQTLSTKFMYQQSCYEVDFRNDSKVCI
uniref:Uncharacterized protein n=1 Tax=Lepeophtheirus salmonis TaxID=72036 RepID=A0A0K2V7V3_LEPSM